MGEGGGEGAVERDAAGVRDEQGDQAGRHHHCTHFLASQVVLDTFRISSAERVPSECGQSRYIADIFHNDICRASSDILLIYFTKIYGEPVPIYCQCNSHIFTEPVPIYCRYISRRQKLAEQVCKSKRPTDHDDKSQKNNCLSSTECKSKG